MQKVVKMRIETCIDYIQYTWFDETSLPMHDRLYDNKAESCHPINGYTFGRIHNYGVRAYTNPRRQDMGEMVLMSGKTLEKMRLDGIEAYDYVELAINSGVERFSRLDLAVDVHDGNFVVDDCESWRKQGLVKTRLSGYHYNKSENAKGIEGTTLYIGTKKSKSGFLRIYDKNAEQGIVSDVPWLRIEAQFKTRKATNVAKKLWSAPLSRAKTTIGIINQFVEFDHSLWREVFEGNKVKVRDTRVNTGEEKRRDWLLTDVASAIAKEINNGNSKILMEIEREVMIKVMAGD